MAAEESTEGAEPPEGYRPLPSVNIPLLREERRATRVKQAAVATALVVTLAGGVSAAVLLRPGTEAEKGPNGSAEEPPPEPEAAATAPPSADAPTTAREGSADGGAEDAPVTPGAIERSVSPFGEARGFRQAIAQMGLSQEGSRELEAALDGVLDFRRCRPEHRMVIERDSEGRLVLFEYHAGPTSYVQATRGAQGELRAEEVEVPVERKRLTRGGRVKTSLGDALETAGLGRSLVGAFVSVFDGHVNFTTDTREGDTFRVIVEEQRIGGEFLRYGTAHALEYMGQKAGELRAYWFEPREGEGAYYDETGRAVQGGWLRTPCRYDHISSRFNPRRMHPVLKRIVPHNGVDYAAGTGTPVWAAADGRVTFAARKGANGNLVAIEHANGFKTLYAHLHRFAKGLSKGQRVEQRQIIGYVGSTGRSTGPHLHFALKRRGRYLDPLEELNAPGKRLPGGLLARFKRHKKELDEELATIRVGRTPPSAVAEADTGSDPVDAPMD